MNLKIKLFLLPFLMMVVFIACSDLQTDITPPEAVSVHQEGFGEFGSPNFHSFFIKSNNWDLTKCQQCHAANYSGGTTGTSCLECHTEAAGPEACNTCHGDFGDPNLPYPPQDLEDNTESTEPGVGAHATHVSGMTISENIGCYVCHPSETTGDAPYVQAHIGELPADIHFGDFPSLNGTPIYDFDQNTCSDVYCHGNFSFSKDSSANAWAYADSVIAGANFSPVWNLVDGTQAVCGTCHMLPPKGHSNEGTDPDALTCANCHTGIVDATGNIVDPEKHINGAINVFGN